MNFLDDVFSSQAGPRRSRPLFNSSRLPARFALCRIFSGDGGSAAQAGNTNPSETAITLPELNQMGGMVRPAAAQR